MKRKSKFEEIQHKLHETIYEADTSLGKLFDVILMWVILISVVLVMIESIEYYDKKYHNFFNISKLIITISFSIEYMARIIAVKKPKTYIFSFHGIIDLCSTLPKYLSLFLVGSHYLVAVNKCGNKF
jgi:voltage-gated potassium channel